MLDQRVVWKPLPGSQTLAMGCPANVILYDGSRGPGKTDAQIMRFRRRVGLGYGKFWRGIIFDREYKNLDDLVSKSQRWFPEFMDGARFLSAKADYKWVWPTGEELMFRTVKKDTDYWNYHGQEFPFIGWNELTKYPNDTLFDSMMSCNRSSFLPEDFPMYRDGKLFRERGIVVSVDSEHKDAEQYLLPQIPLEIFATTNPFGPGHNWVKKRFINAARPGQIVKKVTNVFNPRTQQKEDIVVTQVRIFGSYRENRYLSPQYVAVLDAIKDPNKRKAWVQGSWDVTSGGMFDDLWDTAVHKIRPFAIPFNWKITRSFDWGSSKPFSVGWWAVSDGSDVVLPDGRRMSTVRGDVFRIGEWYGCEEGKNNVGLQLVPTAVAEGIIQREQWLGIMGRVVPGPADNSINDSADGNASIARQMAVAIRVGSKMYNGVHWTPSNKSAGSRVTGWNRIRQYLFNALPPKNGFVRENPGMFVFDTCVKFIDLVPVMPRDETNVEDVDTDAEDHIGDETRYFILDQNGIQSSGRTTGT